MKKNIKALMIGLLLLSLAPAAAFAAFPDDFSDVTWIDPNVSNWAQTANISVAVSGSRLAVTDSKRSVWPRKFHSDLRNDCCNRSLWIFAKYEGRWYAATFEYMRFNQINKNLEAVKGSQIKRPPFLRGGFNWEPVEGEVYGFMTSGMARFNFNNVNVRERSNVALYRWGVGPTDNINFEEQPRSSNGGPVGEEVDEPTEPDEPAECTQPEPDPMPEPDDGAEPGDETDPNTEPDPMGVDTHTYRGRATGRLEVSGTNTGDADFDDDVTITVKDDRTLTFEVSDETFSTNVAQDGSFGGSFEFDVGGLGLCKVTVNVNGVINGVNASGTGGGEGSCLGNMAVFNATFTAVSQTEPNFAGQRTANALVSEAETCRDKPVMAPVLNFLFDIDGDDAQQ